MEEESREGLRSERWCCWAARISIGVFGSVEVRRKCARLAWWRAGAATYRSIDECSDCTARELRRGSPAVVVGGGEETPRKSEEATDVGV